jgi:cellobiose-specific phosphotransferase system component IIB
MATILLVCAAGVSGTFLARRIAPSLPDVEFVVTTEHALDDVLPTADAVLVAPQLAAALDDIRRRVAPRPVGLLDPEAMTPAGSILAVDAVDALVQTLAAVPAAPEAGDTDTLKQRSTPNV